MRTVASPSRFGDRRDPQLDRVAVGELDDLGGDGLGEAGGLGREALLCRVETPFACAAAARVLAGVFALGFGGALRRCPPSGPRRSAPR